jgi:hypothetical protein
LDRIKALIAKHDRTEAPDIGRIAASGAAMTATATLLDPAQTIVAWRLPRGVGKFPVRAPKNPCSVRGNSLFVRAGNLVSSA